ncbi:MAG: non-canonical purine NTP pyrophosphatase [Patescibacteria group bacterium]
MKLLIATQNPGKFAEISEVLKSVSDLQLFSLVELKLHDEVEEHGETHEANAMLKAQYFFKKTGLPTLGEDSGIEVDAFPGELGVQTRRWEGLAKATDEQWVKYFLEKMETFLPSRRGAKFICYAAIILDEKSFGNPFIFSGETRGVITEKLEAPLKAGIPISSCFRPDGFEKVYAALTVNEKNRVSHRGKAMASVRDFLAQKSIMEKIGV